MNTTNEHKALAQAVDTVDDTWKPLTLGVVVSVIIVPVSIIIALLLRLFEFTTWAQSGWLVLFLTLILWGAMWLRYGLRVWGLSMDMLAVKGAIIDAAMAYAESLTRLAELDMGRATVEAPATPLPEREPSLEDRPMRLNLPNGEYKLLPAANSVFENAIPEGVSRRDHVENVFGARIEPRSIKTPVLVDVKGDGSILIDKRDIVRVIKSIYEGGDCAARYWSEQFSQQRYSQSDGRRTQQAIHAYLRSIELLVSAPNKTVSINPQHDTASALAVLGV